MQFEINITSHDLKVILTDLAGKSVVVSVKLKDREGVIEGVNVLKFDREEGVLTICSSNNVKYDQTHVKGFTLAPVFSCLWFERLRLNWY